MPSLEVGFAIDTGGSYESLVQLQSVMDSTEAKIVAEAARIEKATSGMLNLSGSTAQVKSFGNAYTREMENLTRSTRVAESAAERMIKQLDWQAMTHGKTAQEIREMRVEQRALAAESKGLTDVANRLRDAAAEMRRLESAGDAMNGTTGAMRAGFQNVGFQLSDFAVQVGGGTSAIRAASQQAPQLIGAIASMGAGAGEATGKFAAFAGFMGGPWGAAITVGVSILGALASAYYNSADASDTKKDAAEDLVSAINDLHAATVREAQSTWASIQTDIDKANSLRTRAVEARKAAVAELDLAKARIAASDNAQMVLNRNIETQGAAAGAGAYGMYVRSQTAGIEAEIKKQQALIENSDATIRQKRGDMIQMEVAAQYDKNAAATLRYDKALDRLNVRLQAGKISEAQYRAELSALTAAKEAETATDGKRERTARTRAARLTEEQRAIKQQKEETQRFIDSLQDEIAKIGLDEKALRQLEITKQMDAAQTQKQRDAIAQLNVEREVALAHQEAEKAAKANLDIAADIKKAERELALIGLTGEAREKAVIALAEQAKIEAVLVEIQKAEAVGNTELIAQLQKRIDLIREKADVERKGSDMAEDAARTAEKLKLANDQLRDMIGLLGNLGKVGNAIGGLLGIFTGNTSAVGGPLGDLLNIETGNLRWSDREKRDVAETIGDRISDVFRRGGEFSKTIQAFGEALKGAGTGVMSANILGMKSTTEQIGAALGGAAGKALGTAIGGPLGGAIGSVLGGIAGGFVGGLFKKTKSGGATLTGADQYSLFGNSSSRRDAASDLAGSVFSGLDSIAKALGGSFSGGFNTTIGIRGKDYRVNTNGTSLKTSKGAVDFGQDAQAAIAFAIQDAIKDGALMGLRAGTQALLQKEGDFEGQLQKALAFEGVFRDLRAMTNPLIGGLEDLAAKGKQLTEIFTEAGASAEEFAQLQEYMTKQQQALIDQISSTYRSTFFTDAENLALAKKTIKDTLTPLGKGSVDTVAEYKALVKATDALKDPELYGTLMELADEFGVIQDAAEAAKEQAAAAKALQDAIAAQRGALQVELLKAQGKTLEATAKQREMELAAMDASLRPLQKQVWAHQDLAEVYERESANLQSTIDTFGKLGDTLREFRRGLYQTDDATGAYALRLAELQRVGGLAGLGNKDAMGLLPGVGQDFLDVARKQAGSLQDYQRDVARVARYADSAIGAADGMVSEAQAQLDVLEEQVSQFIQLNETALSIEDALERMVINQTAPAQTTADLAPRLDRNNELLERLHAAMESGALASISLEKLIRRTTRNGVALVTTTEDA